MMNPEKNIQTKTMKNIKDLDSDLIKRFDQKLEQEPSLDFLNKLFDNLPKLEMYLVGGMVRDTILKKPTSKDYDFVARKIPINKLIKNLQKLGQVDLVGRNFGVLKFLPQGSTLKEAIDIALPRTEQAAGSGGYRDVEVQSDYNLELKEDLSRRDLTINALAYDLKNKTIIDEFGGMQDLEDKIIRAVGQPEDRFQEDYSRMLRAIRFACRFDFDIEKNTWQAIQKLMTNINKTRINEKNKKEYIVPRETISKELLKTFKANPAKAMELLDQSGAFKQLMPEVLKMKGCEQPIDFHSEGDVWQHTKMMLEKIKSTEFKNQFPNTRISGEFVLGCLLHDAGKPESRQVVDNDVNFHGHDKKSVEIAKKIGRRLNLSNDQKEKITFMAQHHMFLMMVENIFKVSPNKVASRFIDSPHSKDLLMLFYLDSASSVRPDGSLPMKNFHDTLKRIKEIKEIRANQPKKIISGKKIIQTLEINPGPFIGIIIQTISELADQGKINNAKQAENFIKKNKKLLNSYQEKIAKMSKITTVKKDKLVTEILNKL